MTPRSFWMIVIRIIGIWIIYDSIPAIFEYISFFLSPNLKSYGTMFLTTALWLVLTAVFYFLVIFLCIFKTRWIINKLKLDKGFEEERFELKIHRSTVLRIAVIVIGGLLFAKVFPLFCKELILYAKQSNVMDRTDFKPVWSYLLLYFIETFISIYLIRYSRLIVNFIERQRRKLPRDRDADHE